MGKIPRLPRRFTWRSRVVFGRPAVAYTLDELAKLMNSSAGKLPDDDSPEHRTKAKLKAEDPGDDGIRHGLVAHMKTLIASGEYDSPERWAIAEELMFQAILES